MKIQLICNTYPPEVVGGSVRFHSFAKYLGEFGHSTYIITKSKKGMILTKDNDFKPAKNSHVFRNHGFNIPKTPPDTGYIPTFLKTSLSVSKKYKTDIIHASSPSISAGIIGYLTQKITKKPFLFEIRDPWIRAVNIDTKVFSNAYINPKTSTGKRYKKLEEKICTSAKKIVVTNPSLIEETLKVHPNLSEDKFHVIYNAADLDDFKNVKQKRFNKFTIFYSGVMYKSRAIDKLIEAIALTEDVQLFLCGGGPKSHMKYFQDTIKKNHLENKIKYVGVLTNAELYRYYKGSDVLFAGLDTKEANKYLLPSKLFNYMASGNPILATGVKGGDLDKTIRRYKCGFIVNSNDPKKISEAIYRLKEQKSKKLGTNGAIAVKKEFNRKKQTKKLEKIYNSMI